MWSHHAEYLAAKLTRAAGMLAKIRHYVSTETLKSIYWEYDIYLKLLPNIKQI